MSKLEELFADSNAVDLIKRKLPKLFQIAEIESSRAGKTGMEVGSLRERILIALLMYKFGAENVDANVPITETQVDVRLFGEPISVKTITGNGGVKAVWTVDAQSAANFIKNYEPECDILLAQIKWGCTPHYEVPPGSTYHSGGLFLIPLSAQKEVFNKMGKDNYLKMPKPGTNPRGVEFSKEAIIALLRHKETKCIPVLWKKEKFDYDPYKRWVEYWAADYPVKDTM